MTDKENFEKRLLTQLRQVSSENPAPAPEAEPARARPYGRFAVAGAGLAAVVAGIAIYTSTGDNTPSAYAVESQPDGKVSVEITDLKEASGLEQSLKEVGVPAEVNMSPVAASVCAVEFEAPAGSGDELRKVKPIPITGKTVKPMRAIPALPVDADEAKGLGAPKGAVPIQIVRADDEGASFSIDPDEIAEGETVVIAPSKAKPADHLIRTEAASAPPIEVSISIPAEGCEPADE